MRLVAGNLLSVLLLVLLHCSFGLKQRRAADVACDDFRTTIEGTAMNCTQPVDSIVGIMQAGVGEFPHQVLLGFPVEGNETDLVFYCSGALISDRYVLTAAHCYYSGDPKIARVGVHSRSAAASAELDIPVATVSRHPMYRYLLSYHDIALVQLSRPVPLSGRVRPACLWTSEELNGTQFVATGFDPQEFDGEPQLEQLMKLELDLFPNTDCAQQLEGQRRFKNGIQHGQLCVGGTDAVKDTCRGIHDGPLLTTTDATVCQYHVVGVASAVPACGIGQSKAVYTKVSHYIDWIESIVWSVKL